MGNPDLKTIKRLFAVSKNRCAFPNCKLPLVDFQSGKVTGRVCHIKAKSPDGPRYDENQTEKERHAFENLLLMCPIHHDVIDADTESYSVERLIEIKRKHEENGLQIEEPSDNIANQFLTNINVNQMNNGSIIFSNYQMGGQIAHSITNIGPQPRQISITAATQLIDELRQYPPEEIKVTSLMNDLETQSLGEIIVQILKDCGWKVHGLNHAMFKGIPKNIIIEVPKETLPLQILLNWFNLIDFNPKGVVNENLDKPEIIVGTVLK